MEPENANTEVSKELSGKKKNKLYSKILTQMEFYFSDSNLAKDRFVQNLIEQSLDGYVDVEVFTSFNKIKSLTQDSNVIAAAVSKSKILEVSQDSKKLRRLTPLSTSKDFDACTLYVEKLPPHADLKWIQNIFEQFGVVHYISIPRFKSSKKIKGFAFIEFGNPESVAKACEFYYKAPESKESTDSDEGNDQIKSEKSQDDNIATKKRKHSVVDSVSEKDCEQKRMKFEDSVEHDTNSDSNSGLKNTTHKTEKKRKQENSDSEETHKKIKQDPGEENAESHDKAEMSAEGKETVPLDQSNISEGEKSLNVRKKRKHKKKKSSKCERPPLRVMSKFEWKTYRNKYIELQRATMSHIKKRILLESAALRTNEKNLKTEKAVESPKKAAHFIPGIILKVKLMESVQSITAVKDQVKGVANVAYVDAPLGHSEIFIRCHSSEDAQTITRDNKLSKLGSAEIMKGVDEEKYWEKIENERKVKYSTPVVHKKRGREKLLAKANKIAEQKNKHIFFEE